MGNIHQTNSHGGLNCLYFEEHLYLVMHAGSSGPMTPRRREKQRVILPVLGGVCNEENVALGALDMAANPYFKDHAEFQGFLLHNGGCLRVSDVLRSSFLAMQHPQVCDRLQCPRRFFGDMPLTPQCVCSVWDLSYFCMWACCTFLEGCSSFWTTYTFMHGTQEHSL